MTDEGLDLIKLYEGYSPSAYLCPASHWTIGYGAIWGLDNNRVTEEHPDINEEQADQLLRRENIRGSGTAINKSTTRGWTI